MNEVLQIIGGITLFLIGAAALVGLVLSICNLTDLMEGQKSLDSTVVNLAVKLAKVENRLAKLSTHVEVDFGDDK